VNRGERAGGGGGGESFVLCHVRCRGQSGIVIGEHVGSGELEYGIEHVAGGQSAQRSTRGIAVWWRRHRAPAQLL
jgi:hypothetical protein